MCGRFALSLTPADLAAVFGTRNAPANVAPTWNLAPRQWPPVVRRHPGTGERRLDLLQWGLLPHFERDPARARRPINARAETVARLPTFRAAYAARRCLVPAEAFYEWRHDGALRQPYAIARADGAPLALGGLWESWTEPDSGQVTRSFVIVTTPANATLAALHERMPLVLEAADWPVWLGEAAGDPATLLRPAAADVLRLWPVGTRVNNVRNDGPDLLGPAHAEAAAGGPDPA